MTSLKKKENLLPPQYELFFTVTFTQPVYENGKQQMQDEQSNRHVSAVDLPGNAAALLL